jgi:hypothetical protein
MLNPSENIQHPEENTSEREPQPPVYLIAPLPNYTLSTVCPACDAETFRRACKVHCPRCGFVWDCSEL